jgi:hypothetical protein
MGVKINSRKLSSDFLMYARTCAAHSQNKAMKKAMGSTSIKIHIKKLGMVTHAMGKKQEDHQGMMPTNIAKVVFQVQ